MRTKSTQSTAQTNVKKSKEEIIQNAIRICTKYMGEDDYCFITRDEFENNSCHGDYFIDYDEENCELRVESCAVDIYMGVTKDGYDFHNETGYDLNDIYSDELDNFFVLDEACELLSLRRCDLDSFIESI